MRGSLVRSVLVLGALAAAMPARAVEPAGVVACDTLIALRLLTASGTDGRSTAARVADQPACRLIARDAVGEVEHRAMIGGAPFECLTVKGGGPCLWVQP